MAAADLLGELARLGAQRVIQEALEHEQAEHLERNRYERRSPGSAAQYRNGYEPGRVQIGEGEIEVRRPQVRGGAEPYRSGIWELMGRRSGEVERLVVEMYARGLSTRDIEDVFRGPDGEVLLSKASVSEMTDRLWEEYEAFSERDLSNLPVVYLIVDGVYDAMRRLGHVRDGILVAWAILEDGRRVIVHLELGSWESYDSCVSLLHGLKRRGLAEPLLVVSDGALGLVRAIEEAFPFLLRQRCLAHKKRNGPSGPAGSHEPHTAARTPPASRRSASMPRRPHAHRLRASTAAAPPVRPLAPFWSPAIVSSFVSLFYTLRPQENGAPTRPRKTKHGFIGRSRFQEKMPGRENGTIEERNLESGSTKPVPPIASAPVRWVNTAAFGGSIRGRC